MSRTSTIMEAPVAREYEPPTVTHHGRVGEVTLSQSMVFGLGLAQALATSLVGQNPPPAETVAEGPVGQQGPAGAPGAPGPDGVPGSDGLPGSDGADTPDGDLVVENVSAEGGSAPGGAGGGDASDGGGPLSGKQLPFTGAAVALVAGVGVAFLSAGDRLRRLSGRHSQR